MGYLQRRGQAFTEYLQVNLAVAVIDHALLFEEVAGKRRPRDEVCRAGMQRHFVDAGDTFFDKRKAIVIGKAGGIFLHDKQM